MYYPWLEHLPTEVELCAVQLPGREHRMNERPLSHLSPVIDALAPALFPYLNKPFAFFGHSMGAWIGFELAHALHQRYALTPLQLFVSAQPAPQLPNPEPPLSHLPDAEFARELSRLNEASSSLLQNVELMRLVLPVLRADFTLVETYQYMAKAPLLCPIATFGGDRDPTVHFEHLDAWRKQTSNAFSLTLFEGDHFYIQTQRAGLLQTLLHALHPSLCTR